MSFAMSSHKKTMTLVAAVAVLLTAACGGETSAVDDSAGALKGGVPNSPHGKGKDQGQATQAGAAAPVTSDAGVTDTKTNNGKGMGQAAAAGAAAQHGKGMGQAAAAGAAAQHGKSADKGQGKAKSTDAKANKGMGMGMKDEQDADDEAEESAETP